MSWGSNQGDFAAEDMHKLVVRGTVIAEDVTSMEIEGAVYNVSFDSFAMIAREGEGAHGTVSRVQHKDSGALMAAKDFELLQSDCTEKIVSELKGLQKCEASDFIIHYFGVLYWQDHVYVFMELMDCGSLESAIARAASAPIAEAVVAHVVGSVLGGLVYLSSIRVMHRDVKPGNVLLNSRGDVKLCDFSISSVRATASKAQTYIGSYEYMAPERIDTLREQGYTSVCDVWSVGVMAVEMLTGRFPYKRTSMIFQVLAQVVQGPTPIEMETFPAANFSPECVNFLTCCLQKVPVKRKTEQELMKHPFLGFADKLAFVAWMQGLPPRK